MGMFGRDWARHGDDRRPRRNPSGDNLGAWEFAGDVDCVGTMPFRATMQEPRIAIDVWPPDVGDVVAVHADPERGGAKFDKDDARISAKARRTEREDAFHEIAAREPGAPVEFVPGARIVSASPEMLAGLFSADPDMKAPAVEAGPAREPAGGQPLRLQRPSVPRCSSSATRPSSSRACSRGMSQSTATSFVASGSPAQRSASSTLSGGAAGATPGRRFAIATS